MAVGQNQRYSFGDAFHPADVVFLRVLFGVYLGAGVLDPQPYHMFARFSNLITRVL